MDNLKIRSRLEEILGLRSTATNQAKELHSELKPRESDDNIYIRALKRLNPELFHEIAKWEELGGSPGLVVALRNGRKAVITFSIDLARYHVMIREGL